MQAELKSQYPLLDITIGGINDVGLDAGNEAIMAGRSLTWLQDVDLSSNGKGDTWDTWGAEWRDVVVLDGTNTKVRVYNLTTYGLGTPANYEELKGILVDAAMVSQKPYTAKPDPLDVDKSGGIAPIDALLVINSLNGGKSGPLPPPTSASIAAFVDVDANLALAPIDALQVINALNRRPNGEGESSFLPSESIRDESELPSLFVAAFDETLPQEWSWTDELPAEESQVVYPLTTEMREETISDRGEETEAVMLSVFSSVTMQMVPSSAMTGPTPVRSASDQALLEWLNSSRDYLNDLALAWKSAG